MESRDEKLARLIQEYVRRLEAGEAPEVGSFRARAGEDYEEFLELVEIEELLGKEHPEAQEEKLPRRFGEFTLLSLLGEGGFGRVYRAFQSTLGRPVAVKVLRGAWAGDPELMGRFRRGAKAAAQVEHDHVVRILGYGSFDNRPYIAMSCLPGPALHEVISRLRAVGRPPYDAEHRAVLGEIGIEFPEGGPVEYAQRIAGLLAGVADALAEYHQRGICHRDVKPGNLLLDSQGRLVLTDFDLAKGLDTRFLTAPDRSPGTPGYMSPEQLDPKFGEVGGRSDIYALGVVLYELLTLRRLFEQESGPARLAIRVLREDPEDPLRIVPGLPEGVVRVVRKAIQKRPEDRYQDAESLAADLRAASVGEAVRPSPVPISRRLRRSAWRWRTPLLMLLLIAAFLTWGLWPKPATLLVLGVIPSTAKISVHRLDKPTQEDREIAREDHVELPPGRYEVVVSAPNWSEHRETVELSSSDIRKLRTDLLPDREEDRIALQEYQERIEQGAAGRGAPSGTRTAFGGAATPLLPAGQVRRSDLTAFIADIGTTGPGTIEVRDSADILVGSLPVNLTEGMLSVDIPPELRDRLKLGERYRWAVLDVHDRETSMDFVLVPELSDDRAKALDELSSAVEEDRRPILRAISYQRMGLHKAALVELAAALAHSEQEGTGAPALWDLIYDSLLALDLLDSELALDLYARTQDLGSDRE